uniref:Uncharacterized protein n=1 Tax=Oryza rufipogon TaxID=4529 RepID=A0A0E0NUF3_ORYRU
MVAFDRLEMLDPPRELWLKRSSHFVHAWQYDPSSSRPDFVSTCLRQEKAIAANKSRQQLQQEQQHQEQGGAESPKKAESTCPMKYE